MKNDVLVKSIFICIIMRGISSVASRNNPIKYSDPIGAYSVDDENKTITADIDDYTDLLVARNAFFELEKQGFKCQALNKDGDSVEFSTAHSFTRKFSKLLF